MMHKAWRSIEEVPYCFSRSSITFHGHTGEKIDDLNPNWDYLAGRSYQIPQICLVSIFVIFADAYVLITILDMYNICKISRISYHFGPDCSFPCANQSLRYNIVDMILCHVVYPILYVYSFSIFIILWHVAHKIHKYIILEMYRREIYLTLFFANVWWYEYVGAIIANAHM